MNKWLTVYAFIMFLSITSANELDDGMKTFPKKLLARRREEHFTLLKMIANNPKYEHRFQLILIGIKKAFELINEHKNQLNGEKSEKVTKSKIIFIENACLVMDFIVNFTDDIYIVLNKIDKSDPKKNWKELLKLSLDYIDTQLDLLDEITSKELYFVRNNLDKILNEERIADYSHENSVRDLLELTIKSNADQTVKVVKTKKKIKKGPALQGRVEL